MTTDIMVENEEKIIEITDILKIIPHRYPFVMVDRIIDYNISDDNSNMTAIKNITYNEEYFTGHFPQLPVMPGVLIIEAMAQTSAILAMKILNDTTNSSVVLLTGVDKARFRKQAKPGDQLVIKATFLSHKLGLWKFDCTTYINGKKSASAIIQAVQSK